MDDEFVFGSFVFAPARRELTRDGVVVPLGSRACDLLQFLISEPGEVRSNSELIRRVWPDTFVEEANLRVQLSSLRRILDDGSTDTRFIANLPGRGYAFVAPVARRPVAGPVGPTATRESPSGPRIFGRAESIASVREQLVRGRLVTVAGPGGIGKTTVARALATELSVDEPSVWADLSEVDRGAPVLTAAAAALGVVGRPETLIAQIARQLGERRMLIVLDGCEHVVADVAGLAESLLATCPGIRLLCTSREPLRANGERVHRLQPLDLPRDGASAAEVMASPAAQLFVERADACLGGYALSDADAADVADICARLDGIALAIELAAGRLESVSIAGLARSLSESFGLLTRGRRTALPRHQTLRATLDWSYRLLDASEQRALRELSVFRGWFDADSAAAVLSDPDAEDLTAELVAKSLLVGRAGSADTLYRLLDATRLYAREKLTGEGEAEAAMDRLTCHLCERLESAEGEIQSAMPGAWSQDFARLVPHVREALDWAFRDQGGSQFGVRLTVAAVPLFFRLNLADECLAMVTRAIAWLDAHPGRDEQSRMRLYATLGWPQIRKMDDAPEDGVDAWLTTQRLAEGVGDVDHQLRAVWGLWVDAINRAEPRQGMALARRFAGLAPASSDPDDSLIARRMVAATGHWLGHHAEARDGLRAMLADYAQVAHDRHSIRFQFDQRVTARIVIARCQWILGEGEAAMAEVADTIRYATDTCHQFSLSNLLAEAACPLALLSGDWDRAGAYIQCLREHTKALSLDVWHTYADCFEAELELRNGDAEASLRRLRPATATLANAGFSLFLSYWQSVEAEALAALGRIDEALAVLDAALRRCMITGERWCLPELQRIRVAVASMRPALAAPDAERTLETALLAARQDGALAWERRIIADIRAGAKG